MKQAMRKILAVLVVFSLVLSVGIIAISGSAAETVLFSDDFSSATIGADWKTAASGVTQADGKLTVGVGKYAYLNTAEAKTWANYTVEADVTPVGTNSGTYFGGIAVRESNASGISAGNTGKAYEFMLYKRTDGALSVRLYERGGSSPTVNVTKALKADLGLATDGLNDTYTLKVVAEGNKITCYVNGVLAIEATDNTFTAGTVALKSTVLATVFDNLRVTTTVPDAESSSQATSADESSSDTASGEVVNGQILFNDDFSSAAIGADWKTATQNMTQANGKLTVGAGKYAYLNTAEAKAWANYSLEADVTPVGTNTATYFGGIAVRESNPSGITASNAGKAYEFMLYKRTDGALSVRLYERGGSTPTVNVVKALKADLGLATDGLNDTYNLKVVAQGNKITCYVNGVLAIETTDNTFTAGTIALKSTVLATVFDNVVVRAVVAEEVSSQVSSATTSSAPVTSTPVTSTPTSSGSTSSGGKYHFEDNFNSGALHADWAYNYGVFENGKYVINREGDGGASNWVNTSAAMALTDYSIDADFTFLSAIGSSTQPTMSIAFRAAACAQDGTDGKAYEFALLYNKANGSSACPVPNKMYARLYERGGNNSISANTTVALADLLGEGNDDINATYHLRVEVIGNRMMCYVNGVLAFDKTDDTFASGGFGVRSFIREAAVDNLVVDEITEFTKPTLPDEPEYTYPEGVYYEDDFSTADFSAKGWSVDLTQVNEEIRLMAGSYAYLTGKADMLALSDYTVEAIVRMDNTAEKATADSTPGIVGRAGGNQDGYEFALWYNNGGYKVRLYDRKDKQIIASASCAFEGNVYYNLKMVFVGDSIKCYVDDELVLDVKDDTNKTGTAGLRNAAGYPAYYDYFAVRKSTEAEQNGQIIRYEAPEADANGIYFADKNTKADLYTGAWTGDKSIDGNMTVIQRSGNLLLNGNYKLLSDYVVEAEVMVDPENPISGGTQNGVVTVLGRGYELSILLDASGTAGSLRLYDRANKNVLAQTTEFVAEKGKLYTLTLVLSGNRIRSFVDGKLYFDVENTARKNGDIGLAATGYDMRAQNFVVRQVTQKDLSGDTIQNTVIPSTGDQSLTIVFMAVAMCMVCATAILVLRRRKIKQ